MKKVSGYFTRSDPKASKVGADTVLAGRRFHSRTVLGKKEFDIIWSLIRSWFDTSAVFDLAPSRKTCCFLLYRNDCIHLLMLPPTP